MVNKKRSFKKKVTTRSTNTKSVKKKITKRPNAVTPVETAVTTPTPAPPPLQTVTAPEPTTLVEQKQAVTEQLGTKPVEPSPIVPIVSEINVPVPTDISSTQNKSTSNMTPVDQVAPNISEVNSSEPNVDMPPIPQKSKKDTIIIVILITILIVSILFFTGIFIYSSGASKNFLKFIPSSSTPTVTQKPIPSVTPTPKKVDTSLYKIKVLNGSGIIGEAGRIKGLLEKEKFTVSDVGNAQGYDYEDTIIQVKKDIDKEYLGKLKLALSKTKQLGDSEVLSSGVVEDVVVIVGSKSASNSRALQEP